MGAKKNKMEKREQTVVERELSKLMETTFRLEDELNSIKNYE